jgi:hypothetical protein
VLLDNQLLALLVLPALLVLLEQRDPPVHKALQVHKDPLALLVQQVQHLT